MLVAWLGKPEVFVVKRLSGAPRISEAGGPAHA